MGVLDKTKQVVDDITKSAKEKINNMSISLPIKIKDEKEALGMNEAFADSDDTSQAHLIMMKALNWIYEYAIDGNIPGTSSIPIPETSSIPELAEDFLRKNKNVTEACDSMIRWQLAYAGGAGFVTNCGGMLTLPVAIPSNIAAVLYIQIRLISAIAYMGGYDLKSEQVRTAIYLSLLGGGANIILDSVAVQLSSKLAMNTIKQISSKSLTKINQAVGFRLVTKFGTKGILNLGKIIPIIGGVVGGTLDVLTTAAIAKAAKKMFLGDVIKEEKMTEMEICRLKVLINMAKVDTSIALEERELIMRIIDNSDISSENKQLLLSLVDDPEMENVDLSAFRENDLYAYSLLNSLVSIILVDNKVQLAEKMYLKKVAKELGVSFEEIMETINLHKEKY